MLRYMYITIMFVLTPNTSKGGYIEQLAIYFE